MLSSDLGPFDRQEEGARCKASLQAFTEKVIADLGIPGDQANLLRTYDRSRDYRNVYFHFPFCFQEAFPTVSGDDLRTIAFSGILWMSYMRVQDDTMDSPSTANPPLLFLRDIYLRHSIHRLYELFPASSGFWAFYNAYFDEYARSVLREKSQDLSVEHAYDEEMFCVIAKGKAAMAKYAVAAQAVLSERLTSLPVLEESIDCFHIGYQYWDDLVDWKSDLANSSYSLLLAQAFQRLPPEQHALPLKQKRDSLGRIIYYSDLAESTLDRSLHWLERARLLSLAGGCTVWASHVEMLKGQVKTLLIDLRAIVASERRRNTLPSLEITED